MVPEEKEQAEENERVEEEEEEEGEDELEEDEEDVDVEEEAEEEVEEEIISCAFDPEDERFKGVGKILFSMKMPDTTPNAINQHKIKNLFQCNLTFAGLIGANFFRSVGTEHD